ncbi:hypothetical protein [Phaeobacter sp. 22II1-1F12B]|uniref:hypothetical protein n=1 Tax=Phaeobacter sp. 22II1-1F12B TaxID=1317111 RepID=UPI000B527B6D|nr:hypothetical protein [Phaeobacter sp. 22II1-1F12B]OWU80416.1 hypothetical protein ATO1_08675 [Phaeobacter sp. 22II1-1F12B]
MKFKEDLPEDCPKSDSKDEVLSDVWRFLESEEYSAEDFVSHNGKGKGKPAKLCECRWASCSLFVGAKHTAAMLLLPQYKRFKARVELSIPKGSGLNKKNGTHVDFWAYENFDFTTATVRVLKK